MTDVSVLNDETRSGEAYYRAPEPKARSRKHRKLLDFLGPPGEPPNVAEELSKEQLDRIGAQVVRQHDIDKTSRHDWEQRTKAAMDLAMQVAEPKNYPWPKASNVKFPLMTTAAIQFAARAYPAIVSGRDVVKGQVVGSDDGVPMQGPDGQPAADPQGQPVWQVEPGAKRERADRIGQHMSWQLTEEQEEWEPDTDKLLHILPIVGCVFRKSWFDPAWGRNRSELVTADNCVVHYKARTLETAARITQHFELYPHEMIENVRMGLYLETEFGLAPDADGDEDAPHLFYEQHRWLDLDEDGYGEPYIVTVHVATATVVRIMARWDEGGVNINAKGDVAKIDPVHYFTKYGFIPAPDGSFYDVGFGTLLGPISNSVDSTLNLMLDAGHLQNTGGGFIGRGLRIRGGTQRFRPGEFKPADSPGGKLKDNVVMLPFAGPSPVLFQLLGLLIEAGRDITSVKDVMTGEAGPANEPATSRLARIEQGMKVFTAIYKRIYRSQKAEYKKLYRLNRLYLDPKSYFTVLDEPQAIGQKDYEHASVDVVPVADPTVVTDMQKLAKAEFLQGFLDDPYFNGREIRERLLDAVGITYRDELLIEGDPQPGAEVMQAADEIDIKKKGLEIEGMLTEAKVAEISTKMILNLAKAEGEEIGTQVEEYKQNMALLIERVRATARQQSNGDQQGSVPGVAGPPGQQGGAQVPAGLPGPA